MAVYEYQTAAWGHGFLNISLSSAAPALDADFVERMAYRLDWESPALEPRPGTAPHMNPRGVLLDADFTVVRSARCTFDEQGHCVGTQLDWDLRWDRPSPDPWGYALPLRIPPGNASRFDHPNGTIDIGDHRYEPGRLLPSFIGDFERPARKDWFRLAHYESRGPLGAANVWQPEPPLLANVTKTYEVAPDEDQDVLGLGWTIHDAMVFMHEDPESAAILDAGGCVAQFQLSWSSDLYPTAMVGPLRRDQAGLSITLQDTADKLTVWALRREPAFPVPDPAYAVGPGGFSRSSEPRTSDMVPASTCAERSEGPAHRMGLAAFSEGTRPWIAPLDFFHLTVTPADGGSVASGREGLTYSMSTFGEGLNRASAKAYAGRLIDLSTASGQGPP